MDRETGTKVTILLLVTLIVTMGLVLIALIDKEEQKILPYPTVCVDGISYFEETLSPHYNIDGSLTSCDKKTIKINDIAIK